MSSHSDTHRERIALALGGLIAVYLLLYLLGPAGSTSFDSWSGILAAVAEVAAIACCVYAAHRFRGSERLGWALVAAGISAGLIGHLYAAATDQQTGSDSLQVGEVIGVAAYAAVVVGVAALFGWRPSTTHLARIVDLAIVCLALLAVVYHHFVAAPDTATVGGLLASIYLVGSFAPLYVIAASGALRRPSLHVAALTAGTLLVVAGNAVYLKDVVDGGPAMSGGEGAYWAMGLLLLAAAALGWRSERLGPQRYTTRVRALALPVGAAFFVAVEEGVAHVLRTESMWLGGLLMVIFILVVVRLIVTAHETQRGQLEAEVMATQQHSLLNAAKAVSSTLDLDQVIQRVVAELARLLGVSEVGFSEVRADGSACVRQAYGAARRTEGLVTPAGRGLSGLVALRGESVLCSGDEWRRNSPDEEVESRLPDFKQLLGVPVVVRGKLRGVLLAGATSAAHELAPAQVRSAEALGELAAVALGNADTIAEVRKRAAESQALRLAAAKIAEQRDVDEIVSRLARDGRALLGADAGVVAYVDERGRTKWRHGTGLRVENWRDFDDYAYVGVGARVVRENHAVVVNDSLDASRDPAGADPYLTREGLVAALAAPIRTRNGIGAALIVGFRKPHAFSSDEMALLEGLAQQGSIALETARLIEAREDANRELSRRLEATIGALANAIAAEDGYTSDHSRSVVQLAAVVGQEMGLPKEEIDEVQTVAELHDVGKIGVPNEILNKGGALSDEEWRVMRRHPEVGERILAGIPGLESVALAVRHEHEHFDGSGYPDRLEGAEIPLASRIVLVCDAYHAMTSDRPYRKAMKREAAFDELARNASKQFDPDVIYALFRVVGSARAPVGDIPSSTGPIG